MPVFGKPRTPHTGDRPLDRRAPSNKTGARTRQTNTRQRAPYYPLLRTAVDYKRKKCLGCIVAMVPGPKGPRVQVSSRSRVQESKGKRVQGSNLYEFPTVRNAQESKSARVQGSKRTRARACKSTRVQEYKSPRVHAYERARVQGCKSTRVQGCKGPKVQESKSSLVKL